MMPDVNRVLETALYVDNLDRAVRFYRDVHIAFAIAADQMAEGNDILLSRAA